MVIILTLYITLLWLLFFKLKWLPWNTLTQWLCLIVGTVILSGFLVGLQSKTPTSSSAVISGLIVEIAPQVSGRVTSVPIEPMQLLNVGDVLFKIDDTAYQARVTDLEARLNLARLRLDQYQELESTGAGSGFQLEQSMAEVEQLKANLVDAQFNLTNTVVRAPGPGVVPALVLRPGLQVSPSKSVMTFVDRSVLWVGGRFQQKALQSVKLGDTAMINFPALPGQIFESKVIGIPYAIKEGQFYTSGQLPSIQEVRMTRMWPIIVELPVDFPEDLRRVGMAADITIYAEGAGVVGIVATILQWISTSMDAIT